MEAEREIWSDPATISQEMGKQNSETHCLKAGPQKVVTVEIAHTEMGSAQIGGWPHRDSKPKEGL
jgi:hypothetical protein